MADEPEWEAGEPPLTAEAVAAGTFSTAFRGFDPVEVRAFLGRVADELRLAATREAELREALASASGVDAASQAQLDAAREEAARVAAELRDAEARLADQEARLADQADRARLREADAAEQASRTVAEGQEEASRALNAAREEAARTLREAREEAGRLGAEADKKLAEAREAAAVAGIEERREAERDAAVIRVKAREEADAIVEAAKERGREMVSEAQAARERMLKDLARRRRTAQAQLEHLKEARDRVLEHLRMARKAVDDITSRFEPVESGWGVGATPPRPATGAQIAASQAQETVDEAAPSPSAPSPSGPAPSAPAAPAVASPDPAAEAPAASQPSGSPVPTAETADEVSDDVRPATREERKSSALRILRRGRTQPEEPVARRPEEPVEGVRLIGPPPRVTPTEAEPSPAAPEAASGPEGERPEPEPEPSEPESELSELEPELAPELLEQGTEEQEGAESVTESAPEERAPVRPGETLDELFARLRAGRAEAVADAPPDDDEPAEAAERPAPTPAAAVDAISDADESALQRRDVAIEEAEATMVRRLKRSLQDEQNAALDSLRTLRGAPTADALVGPVDVQQQRFRRMATVILGQAATAGASGAASAAPALDDLVDGFAAEVSEALRDRLGHALTADEGEDVDTARVAESVNAVYRDFKGQRAERLAAHYVIAAHARGVFATAPDDTMLRWVVDDGGPCPDCDDNALAGAVRKGEAYPTGQLHPPAHIGCRCLLVPAASSFA